ncbi:MAG: quinolinate synthase NadA [Victivallaceae bacterium]|nr:quinolinate synthase NadA [Victivallaceae bacterium]
MDIVSEIRRLKAERGAVILAHNYVAGSLQDIADFVGDSLELSIKAAQANAKVIVCCGVKFMAETAKLLSPGSTVLLPDPDAGCPMADMADAAQVREYKRLHPDTVLIAYVNSSAEVKAEVDICCTSGNAEKVAAAYKGRPVMFLPDRNLGGNINKKLGLDFELWPGCCPVHDKVTVSMIEAARKLHPGAPVLVHPECRRDVVEAADFALSTAGILRGIRESDQKEFIIGTESGILHRLQKENPGKKFYPLEPCMVCSDMKKITLEQVYTVLRDLSNQIELPPEVMTAAAKPIRAMLEIK